MHSSMQSNALKSLGRFHKDQQGTVAVMFGLLAIPMVLFVGLAVDYSRALSADRDLQEAVDAAALAAALYKSKKLTSSTSTTSEGTITQGEAKSAKQVALDYLRTNFKSGSIKNLSRDAIEGETQLSVTASAEVPATFGALVVDNYKIQAKASVKLSGKPAPICMLGLNPTAADTIKAWGTADLIAPGCAVVSSSTSPTGLVTGGNATMTSAVFCSAGGHSGGGFTPNPQDNCPAPTDPLAGMYTQAALASAGLNVPGSCNQNNVVRVRNNASFNANGGVYTFCGGLNIGSGATVTLGPGVYVFFATLYINSQATLLATQGTTLIFADSSWMKGTQDGYLHVSGGGNILVTAPTSGPTASMAILQPTLSYYDGTVKNLNTHTLIGGGTIEIVGNWYTPQSITHVTGNGTINATSSYFSMISNMIDLEGNGELHIKTGGDPTSIGMTAIPGQIFPGGHLSLAE